MSSKRLKTDGEGAGDGGSGPAFEGGDAPSSKEKDNTAEYKSTSHEQMMASLRAADEKYTCKVKQINVQIENERRTLLASLEKKGKDLLKEAKMEHKQEKADIKNHAPM